MIDVLGVLYEPGVYDEDGNEITPPEPIPGYHVNTVVSIPAFEPYTIHPTTPSRTFGDVEHTVFLQFADRNEWLSLGIEYTDEDGHQAFDTSALQAELDKRRWRQTADCSKRELYLALDELNMLDAVLAFLDAPTTPRQAKIEWETAYRFARNNPLIDMLAPLMEPPLTADQVDDVLKLAQSKAIQ